MLHKSENSGKERDSQEAVWLPVLPPLRAFIELAAFLALIQLAGVLLPNVDIEALEPSPYWLPVLLLSLHYGTVAGLMAAGIATLAYVFNGLPEQLIDEHHFGYLLRVWALPILWIAVALILGQFRLRQIEAKQTLTRDLEQRTQEATKLAVYAQDMERHCHRLEREIACFGAQDRAAVLDAIADLQPVAHTLPSEGLERLCRTAFPKAGLIVFQALPVGLEPVAYAGAAAKDATKPRISADTPLHAAIVGEKRPVCVLQTGDEKLLEGRSLCLVPVLHPEGGRVVGAIGIDKGDARVLVPSLTRRLGVIARLLAPVLAEPRVVVDNTDRPAPAVIPAHARIHLPHKTFAWQKDAPETSSSQGKPSEPTPRPRFSK